MIRIIGMLVLCCWVFSVQAQIQGRVLGSDGEPLAFAEILTGKDQGLVTDERGAFSCEECTPPVEIEVRYLGYEPKTLLISDTSYVEIRLRRKDAYLELVEVSEEHAKQERVLSVLHLSEDFFRESGAGTFSRALDELPGLSAINVGTGIAKPVIRGLYGNRILVNQNGIKQEGQQWGNDHGLEVDPFDVERVEIVKGPSSLQYGSDAMGGVINIMPRKIPPRNSLSGGVTALHKTNNRQWAGSAHLRANYENAFLSARYSRQDFGDFFVPAESFTYNDFSLPLFDGQMKNTAGREESFRLSGGYKSDASITRFTYSRYQMKGGIFTGAIGIPRSYNLQPDGNPRDVVVPFQQVIHHKLLLNQTFIWGDHHWVINLGYQINDREEHSQPEFHSVPASELMPGETLGLGLYLQTQSINTHYEFHSSEQWKWVFGGNAQWQSHEREGFAYLLPDYRTFRSGLFTIAEWKHTEEWTFNGGLRLDYGHNQSKAFTQYIYDSNERLLDSLQSPSTEAPFLNHSFAMGANYQPGQQWDLRVNLARSFRIPYPNETVSNGVHHGSFRHEMGTPNLSSETGWQFDLGGSWKGGSNGVDLNLYANYFEDYIYLRPTARFSRLPEAGQLFVFTQNDAFFSGLEFQFQQELPLDIHYNLGAEALYSVNLEERTYLPFTPPVSFSNAVDYSFPIRHSALSGSLELRYEWTLAQNRVDRNERPTPGYHLFSVRTQWKWEFSNGRIQADAQVANLFNTFYLRHLSRYRLLNLPEQGRNFIFRLSYFFN